MPRKTILLTVLAMLLMFAPARAGDAPNVVVSIKPLHSLVAALMQGVGAPQLLVDGGQTAFNIRLDEAKLKSLADADLVIWVGPELEGFLAEAMKHVTCKGKKLEMLSVEAFKVLPSRQIEGARDPFLWLDVRNAEAFVDVFHEALTSIDPGNAGIYAKNRRAVKARIAALDRKFEYGFRAVAAGEGWAYHNTQQYFSQSYALYLNGYLTHAPGQPADMAKLLKTRNAMAASGKSCLFTEAGMDKTGLELIASAPGVRVAELDSFATRLTPGPDLYETMMRNNFKVISECFEAIGAVYTGPKARKLKPKL